jgi:hypothetical protein
LISAAMGELRSCVLSLVAAGLAEFVVFVVVVLVAQVSVTRAGCKPTVAQAAKAFPVGSSNIAGKASRPIAAARSKARGGRMKLVIATMFLAKATSARFCQKIFCTLPLPICATVKRRSALVPNSFAHARKEAVRENYDQEHTAACFRTCFG